MQRRQQERIAELWALGIKAEKAGWLTAISIGAADADKIIRALKKAAR